MTQTPDPSPTHAPTELFVQYELTQDDLVAMWLYIQNKSSTVSKQSRRVFFYLAVITGFILALSAINYQSGEFPFGPIFITIFWTLFFLLRRSRRNQLKRHAGTSGMEEALSPTTMTLSPEGVILEDDFQHTRLKWLAITHVKSEKDYLFFYINPLSAHAVPKRAFTSEQDADAFYAYARRHCPQHSHCPKCNYSLRGNPGPQCPECGAPI